MTRAEPARAPDVLVVDDVRAVREGLAMLLRLQPGFGEVTVAATGGEAIATVAVACPDVVLMDLRMPGTDGLEAARTIRERHPQVVIVMHSAYEDPALVRMAHAIGIDHYVVKGAPAAELVAELRRAVAETTGRSHGR